MRGLTASGRGSVKVVNRRANHLMVAAVMATIGANRSMAVSTYTGPSGTTASPVTGDWNTANNWSPSGIPAGSTTTELDFLGSTTYAATDDISGAFNLNILKVNGNGSSIAASGSNSLNFTGTNPIFNQSAASIFTVSAPISLGANTTIHQVASGEIDLTGNVSGSSSLTLSNSTGSGNSIVKLLGSNSFNGLVVNPFVTATSAQTSNTTTLGSGTVTLSGGTLALQGQLSAAGAAVEQPIGLTGFNTDLIADSAATGGTHSSTGTTLGTIDGGNLFYENGYMGNSTGGLPTSGILTSAYAGSAATLNGAKTTFDLGYNGSSISLTSNNVLQMLTQSAQTISLTTPAKASNLQFLVQAQNASTIDVQINFSNGTTSTYLAAASVPSSGWATFGGTNGSNAAYQTHNAVNAGGGVDGNWYPTLYESDLTLTAGDQAKTITSIQFTPENAPGSSPGFGHGVDVYAISGDVFGAQTLLGSQTYANSVSVTANSTINIDGSLAATMGNLTIGANQLSIASSNSSAVAYNLSLGTVTLNGNGSGGTSFNVAASSGGGAGALYLGALNDTGTAQTININPSSGTGSVVLGSNATSLVPGTVVNVQNGTLYSNTNLSLGSTATVVLSSPATLVVGASQTVSALNGSGGSVSLGANNLTIGSTDNLSSTFGGLISGSGLIIKSGTGTLTLSGANTFGGTNVNSNGAQISTSTEILSGTVVAAGASVVNAFSSITSGPLGTGAVLVNAGSALNLSNTPGLTLTNPIYSTSSGSSNSSLGALNLSGTTTFSGNVTLGTGSSGDNSHRLAVGASNGGELDFTGNIIENGTGGNVSPVTVSNLSGTGSATVRFTGNNTYGGGTTVFPNVTLAAGPSAYTTTLGAGNVTLAGGTVALQGQLTPGAQQNIAFSGYNADTIVDKASPVAYQSSTGTPTTNIDGSQGFYQIGFQNQTSNGVPSSGNFNSSSTGHNFQFAPLTGLNTVQFPNGTSSHTLTLTTPAQFQTLDFLATSNNTASFSVLLNFSDSTNASIGTFATSDWYNGHAGYNALTGLNPVSLLSSTINNYGGALTMQEYDATLPVADQGKTITSIVVTATANGHSADLYALSGSTAASSTPTSTQTYSNNFSLSANSDIDVSGSLNASIGALTIGGQTLSVTSADNSGSPYSLTTGTVNFIGSAPTFYVGNSNGGGAGTLVLGSLNGGAAQALSKTGPGTLILSQPATLLGEPSVYSVLGGTLASNDPNAMTYNNSGNYIYVGVSVASAATFSIGASQQISQLNDSGSPAVNTSTVLLNGNTLIIGSAHNYNSTFSGTVTDGVGGPGSIVTTGGGVVTLKGSSTYTGTTTVGAFSTLVVANTTGSATGSSNVSLFASTTVTLASASVGAISGNVIAGSQSNIQPGGNGSIGSLAVGGLTTSFHTDLNFDLSGGTGPGVVTGNDLLTLGAGTVNIAANTLLTLGSNPSSVGADYRLIGGSVGGINLSNFALVATPPGGVSYSLSKTVDPGYIDLVVVSSGPNNLLWDNIGTGDNSTWDNGVGGTSQNWNNSGSAASFTSGDNVTFSDVNAGHYTVNLASNVLPTSVTVNSAGTYTIGSTGGYAIGDVPSGTTTLVQSGGGTLNITNVNTYTGATNISGSGTTLHLADTGILASASVNVGAGAIANVDGLLSGSPTVAVSGTLNLGASDVNNNPGATDPLVRTFTSLSVDSGASLVIKPAATSSGRTVLVTSLASNLGKIDLSNNDMIIHNGNAGSVSTAGSIANQIATGFNGGTWTGATGITSSNASTNSLTAIGYAPGGATFDGMSTSSTDILVKYTYYGDANLDGKVDGSDYSRIDSAYLMGGQTGWSNGDFNYDGVVNGSDYTLIDNAFNNQGAQIAAVISSPLAQATDQIAGASSSSAVPEPTSLGLLAMGAVGLLSRRKNRRHH